MRPEQLLQTVSENHEERMADINAHYRRGQWRTILAFTLLFMAVLLIDWFTSTLPNPPASPVVDILNLRATGPTELCPGDTLTYSFEVDGEQRAVLDFDTTLWRQSPPATVIFSQTLRVVLLEPVHYERTATWQLPARVIDPVMGEEVILAAGAYELRIALSTTSRNTAPAIKALPITIREDCS